VTELWQLTKLIRSKNAGPFKLTFDIMFKNAKGFRAVLKNSQLSAELFSRLYGVPFDKVQFFVLEPLLTIKVTIPRPVPSGDLNDNDMYGGQFHGPLIRLAIE
jgi:uncharacterized protein DUF4387